MIAEFLKAEPEIRIWIWSWMHVVYWGACSQEKPNGAARVWSQLEPSPSRSPRELWGRTAPELVTP